MKLPEPNKKRNLLIGILAGFLAVALAGFAYFLYGVLPEKVAQGIIEKASVRRPLTLTPKDHGLRYEDMTFTTKDGFTLAAWWIPAQGKQGPLGTVLLSHGVFKNREQVLDRAELLAKSGYQVLLFDQRGHGASSESPVSGGVRESEDYLSAARMLEGKGLVRKPLVFFGFSMGAMSALRAAAYGGLAEAVIADSPLANLDCYVSRRTAGGAFASFPGFLERCLSLYARRTGLVLSVRDLDLVPVVEELRVPVLFFAGEKDDLARPEEVRKLFERSASKQKRLVLVRDAEHEGTFESDPFLYQRAVIGLLKDLREGFPSAWKEGGAVPAPGASRAPKGWGVQGSKPGSRKK